MAWNKPTEKEVKPAKKTPGLSRSVVIMFLFLAVAVGGGLLVGKFLDGDRGLFRAEEPEESKEISKATPAAEKESKEIADYKPAKKTAATIAREYNDKVREYVRKSPGTNKVEWIVPPLDPKDPDNALRTRVMQELGSLLSVEPGEPMPPFPYSFLLEDDLAEAGVDPSEIDDGNKAFLESLKKWKITLKETDDEKRKEHKLKLLGAQVDLLQGMKEGDSVNDSIRAAYEFRKFAYERRTTIINTLAELAKEEGTKESWVLDQVLDMNKRLIADGIKPMAIEEVMPDYEGPGEEESTDAPETYQENE